MNPYLPRRWVSYIPKSYKSVPNPSFWTLVRNGFPLKNKGDQILEFLAKSQNLYGDILTTKIPLGPKIVVLFNPYDAEKVYQSTGKWPTRPGFLALDAFRSKKPMYEHSAGLLSSQNKPWYDFRSKVQVALLKPKLIKSYHERVDGVAKDFIQNVFHTSLEADGHASPDLIEHLYQWGLESTGILAFDRRLGVINPSLSSDSEPQEIVNCVQRIFTLSQSLEINLIWKIIGEWYPDYKEILQLFERMEELANKYTDEKIMMIESGEKESETSVIEYLYKAGCSRNILSTLAIDMLMAGVDTAANQISFVFYFIAKHLDVQEKLYKEVKSLNIQDPNFMESAPYLRACLKEVLRMRPTVFANNRLCKNPVDLNGFMIEEGSMVSLCHMSMCHDPRFVNEPSVFRPERHIKGHPLFEKLHPFLSLPFGHGPRVCVGKRFANLEICLLLSRIVMKYKLEATTEPLKLTVPFLLKPSGAIPVRFISRE